MHNFVCYKFVLFILYIDCMAEVQLVCKSTQNVSNMLWRVCLKLGICPLGGRKALCIVRTQRCVAVYLEGEPTVSQTG